MEHTVFEGAISAQESARHRPQPAAGRAAGLAMPLNGRPGGAALLAAGKIAVKAALES